MKQQGYREGEFHILDESTDIEYISRREIELQKEYGYNVDATPYVSLIFNKNQQKLNNMEPKLNFTKTTTTFPCKASDMPQWVNDNTGAFCSTSFGAFVIDEKNSDWLIKNALVSQFDKTKCYIYNNAFERFITEGGNEEQVTEGSVNRAEHLTSNFKETRDLAVELVASLLQKTASSPTPTTPTNRFNDIRDWASTRGIYKKGDIKTQYIKLMEEAGELAEAILDDNKQEIVDAIGDCVVVLTNLAHIAGFKIEDCVEHAYDQIRDRKGKMVGGTFVKEESLIKNQTL